MSHLSAVRCTALFLYLAMCYYEADSVMEDKGLRSNTKKIKEKRPWVSEEDGTCYSALTGFSFCFVCLLLFLVFFLLWVLKCSRRCSPSEPWSSYSNGPTQNNHRVQTSICPPKFPFFLRKSHNPFTCSYFNIVRKSGRMKLNFLFFCSVNVGAEKAT